MRFALALMCCVAVGLAYMSPMEKKFVEWQKKSGRFYSTEEERQYRFGIWQASAKRVGHLNSQNDGVVYDMNRFADLTEEEFEMKYLSYFDKSSRADHPVASVGRLRFGESLPDTFSWVEKGAVTPVKNQASCGSCYSFSVAAAAEGQWYLHGPTRKLVSLSAQTLVSCDRNQNRCRGGDMITGYKWIIKNGGLMSEQDYPYTSGDGSVAMCQHDANKVTAKFTNYTMVPENEEQIRQYLYTQGPLSIAIAVSNDFKHYSSGVYDGTCAAQLNHAILLVGWGTENGKDYWLIKNSWGTTDWGMAGYGKMARGKNLCGIREYVSTILV